jgi:hypothetical protein
MLAWIWLTMQETGRDRIVFFDGTINSIPSFISFVKNSERTVFLMLDSETSNIPAFSWLDTFGDGCVFGHFCYLEQGNRAIAKAMMDFWRTVLRGSVSVMIGLIPESNMKAIAFTEHVIGWTRNGKIPKLCRMFYKGNIREDAILFTYEMET